MRLGLLFLLLCGCHQLFGLTEIQTRPDAFSPDSQCPLPDYNVSVLPAGSRYRLVTISQPPRAMHLDCLDDTDGLTHLAALDSPEELAAVVAKLEQDGEFAVWVGAIQERDQPAPDVGWRWLTGELIDSAAWDVPNEPNDFVLPENNDENAAHLQMMKPGLVDGLSGAKYHALCECDGRAIDPTLGALYDTL
jgi:hypothetical protein